LPLSRKRYATFHATAGLTYQIGVFGTPPGNSALSPTFNIEISLVTLPIILESPATRYATPGQDALLTVATAQVDGVGTQIWWRRNGSVLSATGPVLALTNAAPADAGSYDAIVSMDFGGAHLVKTSAVAQLVVTPAPSPTLKITRKAAGNGEVVVDIAGEPGRAYFLVSHYPQRSWIALAATDFPFSFLPQEATVFYNVRVFEAASPLCHLNLTRIRFAKERIAADRKLPFDHPLSEAEITQYLGYAVRCPGGGLYTYEPVDYYPHCTLTGHFLE
jgi:hypothetical protein